MDRRAIRSKKNKPRTARPYDRPGQSLLGKVASKVKGILNPSWIFNVSQRWMSTASDSQPGSSRDEESEEDEEENVDVTSHPENATHSKRPRLDVSGSFVSHEPLLPPPIVPNPLIENKEAAIIMNGEDDHSENSEGSASTSGCSSLVSSHKDRIGANLRLNESALASLRADLKITRKGLSPNVNASRLSLWSGSEGFSPSSSKFPRRTSVANTSQPGFNVSAFVGPIKASPQTERKVSSPFYQGKTAFGGASSCRRMPASVAPYQVERHPRNQIKVRPSQLEDNLEGMSSAAKRILLTLEKMSSPVTDAKKIPNTNRSPVDLSLYLMPPKHRSNVTPSSTVSRGPPIANISTISKLTTLKGCSNRKFQNSTMPSLATENSIGDSFKHVIDDVISAAIGEDVDKTRKSLTTLDNSYPDFSRIEGPKSGGGKMRSKLTQKHQPCASSDSLETALLALETAFLKLPEVQLPPITSLPTFSFEPKPDKSNKEGSFVFSNPSEGLSKSTPITAVRDSPVSTETAFLKLPEVKLPPTTSLPTFSFASKPDKSLVNKTNKEESFVFSNPIEGLPKSSFGTVRDSPVITISPPDFNFSSPIQLELPSNAAPSASTCLFGGNELATWLCTCWVQNTVQAKKCLSCGKQRSTIDPAPVSQSSKNSPMTTVSSDSTKSPATVSFQTVSKTTTNPSSSMWECSACWVKNPAKEVKCLACTSDKPEPVPVSQAIASSSVSISSKDSINPGSWKCSSCCADNEHCETKCSACKTLKEPEAVPGTFTFSTARKTSSSGSPKPSPVPVSQTEKKSSLTDISTSDSAKPGTWKCSTCCSNNALNETVCASCKTVKESKTVTPAVFTSGFKPSVDTSAVPTWDCGDCWVKNPAKSVKCWACESPKPGVVPVLKDVKKSSSKNIFASDSSKPEAWKCSICRTDNILMRHSSGTVCVTCKKAEVQPATVTPPATVTFPTLVKASSDASSASTWECSSCWVRNPTKELKCLACQASKPDSVPAPQAVSSSSSATISSKDSSKPAAWKCSSCWIENTLSEIRCVACKAAREPQGVVPPAPIAFPTVSKSGTSSSSTWECSSCWVRNPTEKTKCMACETANPNASTSGTSLSETAAVGFGQSLSSVSGIASTIASSAPVIKGTTLATPNTAFSLPASAAIKWPPAPSVKTESPAVTEPKQTSSSTEPGLFTSVAKFGEKPSLTVTPFSTATTSSSVTTTLSNPPSNFLFFASTAPSTATTTTTSAFTFGASNPSQPAKPGGFTFKPATENKTNPVAADTKPPSLTVREPATSLTFNPGASTTVASNVFKFGSTTSVNPTAPSGGFSFGAKTEPASTAPSGFAFGTGAGFGFKGAVDNKPNPLAPNTSMPFSSVATTTASSTVFKFGSTAPAPASGFTFGQKAEPASSSSSGFTFGTVAGATNSSAFTSFQSNSGAVPVPPTFQFGSQPSEPAPAVPTFGTGTSGGFSFGIKNETANQLPTTQASTATFGMAPAQMQTIFGSSAAPDFAKKEKPAFSFGGSQSTSTPLFQFGAAVEKKPASSAQFSFGTPAVDAPVQSSFPTSFNMSTPPSFNFGASASQAGPFQFAASSENQAPSGGQRKIRKALRRNVRKE